MGRHADTIKFIGDPRTMAVHEFSKMKVNYTNPTIERNQELAQSLKNKKIVSRIRKLNPSTDKTIDRETKLM